MEQLEKQEEAGPGLGVGFLSGAARHRRWVSAEPPESLDVLAWGDPAHMTWHGDSASARAPEVSSNLSQFRTFQSTEVRVRFPGLEKQMMLNVPLSLISSKEITLKERV